MGLLRGWIRNLLRRRGYAIVRHHDLFATRNIKLFRHHRVSLVLDVGANAGQYAAGIRRSGYEGRIISFEPLTEAYEQLHNRASSDPLWEVVRCGLGDRDTRAILHVAGNSQSSSFRAMLQAHLDAAPHTRYIGQEEVQMQRLDTLWKSNTWESERVFLKIDAQGYEREILEGAGAVLDRILGIQLEMQLVELYDGEALFDELLHRMTSSGFTFVNVHPAFDHRGTGQVLSVDGVFYRGTTA